MLENNEQRRMGTFHVRANAIDSHARPRVLSQRGTSHHLACVGGKVDAHRQQGSRTTWRLRTRTAAGDFALRFRAALQAAAREVRRASPRSWCRPSRPSKTAVSFSTAESITFRLAEAAWIDFTHQRHKQGGSTITMQLSRAFFLTPEKTFRRKLIEMLIAVELEQKFSKEEIFEFYANRVDLGQRGSFTISGFAEASRSYFNKDLKDINLPEAALLAGLIQAPSYLSPYRHPERALERRNLVLDSMVETEAITRGAGRESQGRAPEAGAAERRSQRRSLLRRSGSRSALQQSERARA